LGINIAISTSTGEILRQVEEHQNLNINESLKKKPIIQEEMYPINSGYTSRQKPKTSES